MMTVSRFEFYECDNPVCKLRFPGYEGYPKSNRCPVCRSTIHSVRSVTNSLETSTSTDTMDGWRFEALLDNIRSTWNVGSIFRTSDGIGIRKIYLCGITPTPENARVSRTALGAESTIPWERYNNAVHLARLLKSRGYCLWALEDLPEAENIYEMTTTSNHTPKVLIVGNEMCGVDPGLIEMCDKVISIPMLGKKQSYNVAVAFGMATSFLLYRQRVSQGSFKILPNT
jgi:23S rRNA (guanosine2251-2'-O)-methyltransferase